LSTIISPRIGAIGEDGNGRNRLEAGRVNAVTTETAPVWRLTRKMAPAES